MKQQQNLKTCIYLNGKKKEKSSQIDNEKVYALCRPNEISFTTETDLKSQHTFHQSKFNLILSILLLYTYSVCAGKTFGEMLDDLGSFELYFDSEIDESNLPDYGSAEELIAAAEEDCKKLDEYCEKMDKFHNDSDSNSNDEDVNERWYKIRKLYKKIEKLKVECKTDNYIIKELREKKISIRNKIKEERKALIYLKKKNKLDLARTKYKTIDRLVAQAETIESKLGKALISSKTAALKLAILTRTKCTVTTYYYMNGVLVKAKTRTIVVEFKELKKEMFVDIRAYDKGLRNPVVFRDNLCTII